MGIAMAGGALNRHPLLGIEFPAYQKIWRLAGVDQVMSTASPTSFGRATIQWCDPLKCLKPMFGNVGKSVPADSFTVLPVVSSGQWGGQACETYRRTKTVDLLYMAGGGIMAHPDGPAVGVKSLQKWWAAAVEGLTLEEAAVKYPELKKSVEKFGKAK